MKQFKVGDEVVRVGKPYAHQHGFAHVGQRATVVRLPRYAGGAVVVRFKSGLFEKELSWAQDFVEPAPKQEECKFIPGKIYKDREGGNYTFLLHVPSAVEWMRAVFLNYEGCIEARTVDGVYNIHNPQDFRSILPNKRTRTICVYKNLNTEEHYTAQTSDGTFNMRGWKKVGEVVEEYEEY